MAYHWGSEVYRDWKAHKVLLGSSTCVTPMPTSCRLPAL